MLSQLPISEGETVRTVLLAQRGQPGPSSLPNQVWTPVSPILMGTYNGIGGISKVHNGAAMTQFYEALAISDQNKARFFSGDKALQTSVDGLLDSAAEGNCLTLQYLTLSGLHGPQRVSLALIRPEVCAYALAAVDEMAQAEGISLEELGTGTFDAPHPTLKALAQLGADIAPVLKLNLFLREMRMQWQPQSGAGNQCGIEHTWQTNYYEVISTIADGMLTKAGQQ